MGENIFEEIGHETKVVAEDIGHVIVEAVEFPDKATKVIAVVVKDGTPLKADFLALLSQGKTVLVDGVAAAEAKGLNWTEDVETVQAVMALAKQFETVIVPAIEQAYTELNSAVV